MEMTIKSNNLNLKIEKTPQISLKVENQSQVGLKLSQEQPKINKTSDDYEDIKNKPQINSVELIGNKTSDELYLQPKGNYANTRVTNIEIDNLFK